jgi:hypothetical protein
VKRKEEKSNETESRTREESRIEGGENRKDEIERGKEKEQEETGGGEKIKKKIQKGTEKEEDGKDMKTGRSLF